MDKQLGAGLSACHRLTNLLFIFRQDVPVRLPSVSSIYHRHVRRPRVSCIPIDKMLVIQLCGGTSRKQLISSPAIRPGWQQMEFLPLSLFPSSGTPELCVQIVGYSDFMSQAWKETSEWSLTSLDKAMKACSKANSIKCTLTKTEIAPLKWWLIKLYWNYIVLASRLIFNIFSYSCCIHDTKITHSRASSLA